MLNVEHLLEWEIFEQDKFDGNYLWQFGGNSFRWFINSIIRNKFEFHVYSVCCRFRDHNNRVLNVYFILRRFNVTLLN